jgi:hypothetical protein
MSENPVPEIYLVRLGAFPHGHPPQELVQRHPPCTLGDR